jgi:SAM-dependent methyltransferase
MTQENATFVGSIPATYDEALGPMFFEPYAADLAQRLELPAGATVVEVAAGTGIVTRRLLGVLPKDGRLIATDISDAMLAFASSRTIADRRLEWRTADATTLPFDDASVDAIVCQFGIMFFPDKRAALREAHRVLKPSGTLLFNVWGSLSDNPIARIVHETVQTFFHLDPPQFYTIPFGMYEPAIVLGLLREAGSAAPTHDIVDRTGVSASAELAAKGLVFGSPILTQIVDRGTVAPAVIMHAVASRLAEEGGAAPMQLPMRALVFTAIT